MITPADLISPTYRESQVAMHQRQTPYGERGFRWSGIVADQIRNRGCSSVLDYGCGAGTLARDLVGMGISGLRVAEYDPGIPGKDRLPDFADLVVCTDVLEHVEMDRLDTVLTHLKTLARKAVFAVISTRSANHILPDGRNAHLIVQPADWWLARVEAAGFTIEMWAIREDKEVQAVLVP